MKFLHCSCNQRIFVHSCHHWYIVYATTLYSSWWRSPNMKKGVSKSRFLAVLAGFTKEARQGRPPHWLSIWVAHGLTCQRLSADVIFDIKIFLEHNSFLYKSIQDLKWFAAIHGGTARNQIKDNHTMTSTINLPIPHNPLQRSIFHIWPVSAPLVETSYEPSTWTEISFHAQLNFWLTCAPPCW